MQSIDAEDGGASGMPPSGSVRRLEAGVQGGSQPGAGRGPAQGLSTEALHSRYTQCLKLAAENKITQKNTWDLSIVMDQARRACRLQVVPAGSHAACQSGLCHRPHCSCRCPVDDVSGTSAPCGRP